jgi:hypothetical protein
MVWQNKVAFLSPYGDEMRDEHTTVSKKTLVQFWTAIKIQGVSKRTLQLFVNLFGGHVRCF